LLRSLFSRIGARLSRHRGLLFVTLAALAVRLVWNLKLHRPLDFAYSDMGGYLERANEMFNRPWKPAEYLTLYPYGTHYFIFAIKAVFGRTNATAIGVAFAVLGTLAVSFTYATARRFSPSKWVRRITAFILIFYYPWISLGGYTLSEIPFTFCAAAAAFYGLRLADQGRRGDAWLLGLFLGLGATVRPQMLVAVVFLAIHLVVRRRAWKNFTRGLVPRALVPLALILAFSAARLHWHSGHWGLISTNGPLNAVFGRCHNTGLAAKARDGGGFFGPPSLGALLAYEKEHKNPIFTLDPAMGVTITFTGHMWDEAPNRKLAADCVKKTGWLRQAKYAVTHVVLLWGYNIIWPDQGQPKYRMKMAVFCVAHSIAIMPPAALAMILAFRRRRARSMLLALHVWSQVLTAMLYFGDTRYRAPYDGLLTILAIQFVLVGVRWLRGLRGRRQLPPMVG
jgi:hypothetical protein